MALFIRKDDGSGDFFPDRGGADLISISCMDVGYEENNDDDDWVEVGYSQNKSGVTADRLDELVNTIADPIRIFPVDGTFTLSDGTSITDFGGVALPVDSDLNPQPGEISTIYDTSDCDGAGYCVFAEGGGETGIPTPVMLYHELAHCLHFATDIESTEPLAQADENDMRDKLDVSRRDVDNHGGGCGGCPSTCCIVASISTGSAFSSEVSALRRLRDSMLRRGPIGADFFDHLHRDYYAFSPETCRVMADSSGALDLVRERFVVPLICVLELLRDFIVVKATPDQLEERLHQQLRGQWSQTAPSADSLQESQRFLRLLLRDSAGGPSEVEIDAVLADQLEDPDPRAIDLMSLAASLRPASLASSYIRWALLESVAIWFEAALQATNGATPLTVGQWLEQRFIDWAGSFPLSPLWHQLNSFQTREAVTEIEATLLHHPAAKAIFMRRLSDQ